MEPKCLIFNTDMWLTVLSCDNCPMKCNSITAGFLDTVTFFLCINVALSLIAAEGCPLKENESYHS